MGRRPIYLDLDVGQGSISIPGTIGATIVSEQVNIIDGFDACPAPLVYNFGHKAPGLNLPLYNNYVTRYGIILKHYFASILSMKNTFASFLRMKTYFLLFS